MPLQHIVLYILDALRADHLGCYGYHRDVSPNIDALANEGVIFNNCFTSSTWTRPVAASILTGVYPQVHLTRTRQDMFSHNISRLPELLQNQGFKSFAISSMGNIASEIGFDIGFDQYSDLFRDAGIITSRRRLDGSVEGLLNLNNEELALPLAEDINSHYFPKIDENRDGKTFSFLWSIETHVPYHAPIEFRIFSELEDRGSLDGERTDIRGAHFEDRQRLMDLYDEEIYYNDHCIGKLVSHLKKLGIYDDTLLIVAGDHGDAFYEHGFYAHGHTPYEELIHVPLIIKFPQAKYRGKTISSLIELIDIYPTVLAAVNSDFDFPHKPFIQGKNLLHLLDGSQKQIREFVYSETQSLPVHNRYLSVRDIQWKFIMIKRPKRDFTTAITSLKHIIDRHMIKDLLRTPRHFLRTYFAGSNAYLFDLSTDPGEQNNLISQYPDLVKKYKQILESWDAESNELAVQLDAHQKSIEKDEILTKHLEKLGYL